MAQAVYDRLQLTREDFKLFLVKEYWENKQSQAKIAEKVGCHVSSIEQWFEKFGIERRTQSEALANRWEKCAELSTLEKQQLFGWLLSDGTLVASDYSARFTIGLKHKSVLKAIKRSMPSLQFTPIWTSGKTKCSHMKSHSYVNLKEMHAKWYSNGLKCIPKDLFLSPETMYYWFIGDGSRVPYGIQLSTESFSKNETKRLSNLLHELKINNTVLKSNRIRIKSNSVESFYEYIGPCRHKIYQYKWRTSK